MLPQNTIQDVHVHCCECAKYCGASNFARHRLTPSTTATVPPVIICVLCELVSNVQCPC